MNIDQFSDYLTALGIVFTRDGSAFNAGGSLYLRSLTSLPEGVSLSAGGYLDLHSLTSLPEGVSLSAGGSLYLRSLTSEDQTYQGRKIKLRTIDGICTRLISKRTLGDVNLWSAQYFRGGLNSDKRCFVAQLGDTYAHGETADGALRDLRFKVAQRDLDVSELVQQIKERGTVEFNDYRLLTGACVAGMTEHLKAHGIDPEATSSLPLAKALEISRSGFGGSTFASLMEKAA